ncbi:MAG: adenylate cyclase [Actinomycetota bacterium]
MTVESDRVDALLDELGITGGPLLAVARPLLLLAVQLGASDEETLTVSRAGRLGPFLTDLAVRPKEGETLTLDEYVARSDMDPALVREVWTAFGLPTSGVVPPRVTPDAGQAIEVVVFMSEFLGRHASLALARVIGAATASIADTLANSTRIGAEVPNLESGRSYDDVTTEMTDVAQQLLPTFWEAVGAIFRRHLVLVSYGSWAPDEATAVTTTRAVGFVDLVGSTEVLRSQSVAELAASVDAFERLVWERVTGAGGRVVKLIGDEAMFVVDRASAACDIARALVDSSPQAVRVGLAYGDIVALHGDCYGPTVNLAARLVAIADAGTVLVSEEVVQRIAGLTADAIDVGPLRGFPEVTRAFVLSR